MAHHVVFEQQLRPLGGREQELGGDGLPDLTAEVGLRVDLDGLADERQSFADLFRRCSSAPSGLDHVGVHQERAEVGVRGVELASLHAVGELALELRAQHANPFVGLAEQVVPYTQIVKQQILVGRRQAVGVHLLLGELGQDLAIAFAIERRAVPRIAVVQNIVDHGERKEMPPGYLAI